MAVLDVDYHHGNGTQDIFYERDDVRFCSIHGDPSEDFPYFLGHADEHGAGRGTGHNRNLPLPRGTEAETWFDTLEQAIGWLNDSAPTALVVSLGLDTFVDDPISHFRLQQPDFIRLGQRLAAIELPTVLVMEGVTPLSTSAGMWPPCSQASNRSKRLADDVGSAARNRSFSAGVPMVTRMPSRRTGGSRPPTLKFHIDPVGPVAEFQIHEVGLRRKELPAGRLEADRLARAH